MSSSPLTGGDNATSGVVIVTVPPSAAPSIAGGGTSTSGAYTISWTGESGATSYNLIESVNGGGWVGVQNNGATNWSTSGRGNGTYVYQVQACNGGGCGPYSGQAVVTVSLAPPSPTGVQTIKTTAGSNTYRFLGVWGTVAGATRYEVQSSAGIVYSGTTNSYTLQSGSVSHLTGSYWVRSCNASACSAWVQFPSA